jgi:hypothetical protein
MTIMSAINYFLSILQSLSLKELTLKELTLKELTLKELVCYKVCSI